MSSLYFNIAIEGTIGVGKTSLANIIAKKLQDAGFYDGDIRKRFPNAVKSTTNTFFLGTSPVITQKQLSYINEVVDKFFSQLIY